MNVSLISIRNRIEEMHEFNYNIKNLLQYDLSELPYYYVEDIVDAEDNESRNLYINYLVFKKECIINELNKKIVEDFHNRNNASADFRFTA